MSNDRKITAKELRDFMNHHGLSVKEFAKIFGVTLQAVKLWLNGQREVSLTNSKLIRLFKKYPKLLREF